MNAVKKILKSLTPLIDIVCVLFVYPSALLLKAIRRVGVQRMRYCKKALLDVGVFPIRNHYYEPQFDYRKIDFDSSVERNLPGINWNISGQLEFLDRLVFAEELENIPLLKTVPAEFHFNNGSFESGDAEYWYQLIRAVKPRRIFEIGSGNSTLMAVKAIAENSAEDSDYSCEHVCIEPYEMPWLEGLKLSVIREKVEEVEIAFFERLQEDDILFIDSSHIIRPHGDVLFEYLEVLPALKPGVIVHIHDIFSPRNYPNPWVEGEIRLWNEQYLLEAFLSHNTSWSVIGAVNYLHHNHSEKLCEVAPYIKPEREPGSFYIRKTA